MLDYKNGLVSYFATSDLRKQLEEKKAFDDNLTKAFEEKFKEYTRQFISSLKDYKASDYGDVRELGM
ncbi:hypothetical protein J6W20_01380 [bacterium]|nr:hypothetical protein [bacterium]